MRNNVYNSTEYSMANLLKFNFRPGDHIYKEMTETDPITGKPFFHHGLISDVNLDKREITVIDKIPMDAENNIDMVDAQIKVKSFKDFIGTDATSYFIVDYENYDDEQRQEAIKKAKAKLELNEIFNDKYHLLLRNCDDFIMECLGRCGNSYIYKPINNVKRTEIVKIYH